MGKVTRKFYGPPGTGKTTLLMSKVTDEIASGVHPSEITYCSFTRAASYYARDLAIAQSPHYTKEDFKNFATIHAICYRLLGLTPHSVFAHRQLQEFAKIFNYKFSDDVGKDMFSQALIEMSLATDADYYENFISWQKNMMLWDFDEAYSAYLSRQVEVPVTFSKRALQEYISRREEFKRKEGLWDFGDMLTGVLRDKLYPEPNCKVFFLDEAQDCSKLLFEVAKLWSNVAERVYIAGDPYQAIYVFAGADPNLMIDFKADETVTLKQSYRCSKTIHQLSRKLVERFKTRYPDDDFIPTEREGIVTKTSMEKLSFDSNESAFALFRTRYLMEDFVSYLMGRGIPFTTRRGKQSPLDKAASEAVLSLVKLSEGERIAMADLNKMVKLIPSGTYLRRGSKQDIAQRAREDPKHLVSKVSLPALGFTTEFVHLLDEGEYLESLNIEPEEKRYFRSLLKSYGRQALVDKPKLQVGTIHSAKGLEAERVILSLELTRLPYENLISGDPDSEHRVYYVGITRAKEEVSLLLPETWRAYSL